MKSRLETSRTWMRPFEPADAVKAFRWLGDPEVMRFIPHGPDLTLEKTAARVGRYIDHQNRHGFSKWIIIDRQSGKLMGDSGFYLLPDGKGIELGYRLARDCWSQGFGTEVARKWVEVAGDFTRETTIFAFADPANAASLRVMEKLGFEYIRDETLYGLTEPLYGLEVTGHAQTAIAVRRAETGDSPVIAALLLDLGYPAEEALVRERLEFLAAGHADAVFVAECDGEVAGFLSFHVIPLFHLVGGLGRITALSVNPRFQRRGVGRELVAAAESFGWDRGCLRIEVTSGDRRTDAHAFYQAAGYREDIRRFVKDAP